MQMTMRDMWRSGWGAGVRTGPVEGVVYAAWEVWGVRAVVVGVKTAGRGAFG